MTVFEVRLKFFILSRSENLSYLQMCAGHFPKSSVFGKTSISLFTTPMQMIPGIYSAG